LHPNYLKKSTKSSVIQSQKSSQPITTSTTTTSKALDVTEERKTDIMPNELLDDFHNDEVGSPELQSMLEEENKKLQIEFNTLIDQVREAEKKILEISALQQLFSTKVMEQAKQIEELYDTAVQSTMNVDSGNKMLVKTKQDMVGFRLYMLVFLIMASFILLFLHWYD